MNHHPILISLTLTRGVLVFLKYLLIVLIAAHALNYVGVVFKGLEFLSWWPYAPHQFMGFEGPPGKELWFYREGAMLIHNELPVEGMMRSLWLKSHGYFLVYMAIGLALCICLKRIVDTVRRKDPFVRENVTQIRIMGAVVLLHALVIELCKTIGSYPLVDKINEMNDPGLAAGEAYFTTSPYPIFLGLILLVLSEIFRQGIRLREERETLEKKLVKQKKLETASVLAGGITHDFKNILTSIIGYAEIAREENNDLKLKTPLDRMLRSLNRAKKLVQTLREIGCRQRDATNFECIDLKEELEDIGASLAPTFPPDIEIRCDLPDRGTFKVLADTTKLYQVLLNVSINAVQAMKGRAGTLTYGLDREVIDGKAWCRIRIHDTGCGMTPEVLEHIFEPYFTTRPVEDSSGLGLAMCYGIVSSHGGLIHAESESGQGSTFNISLPVAEETG